MSKNDPARFSTDKEGIELLGEMSAESTKALDEALAKRAAHTKAILDKIKAEE
jgi:hypothetical protein